MCAAALLRRGGEGCGGLGGERGEAARRCPVAPRAGGAPLAPLRPSAAAPRCRPAADCRPSAARRPCKPAGERAGLWRWGARGVGWGVAPRLRHPPPALPPAAAHPRVCGAAAASRQNKRTALHCAAYWGHAPCAESLLKAGADASLKDTVSDGAKGRGGRRGGGRGEGRGGGGRRGPITGVAPPLRAAHPQPSPPRGRPPPPPPLPPPRRRVATRRWTAPRRGTTRRSSRSWRTPPPTSQRTAARQLERAAG